MKSYGIVMAGGSGERFWPLSRPDLPKQLLKLSGSGKSLLEESLSRLAPVVGADHLYVSTSTRLVDPIADSGLIEPIRIIAEPCKRNTAGALVWTMAYLAARESEPFLAAITTSDHAIGPNEAFQATVRTALELAEAQQALVTIGIVPTRAETGYGYIEISEGTQVRGFREKPDASTATAFLHAGNFLWNSGMFFWRSDAFAAELTHASPVHADVYQRLVEAFRAGDDSVAIFEELPNVSIDYALMERAQHVQCVRSNFAWDDVGTWDALLRTVDADTEGNSVVGPVAAVDTSGSVLYNASNRKVFVLGGRNIVVVVTDDEVLVADLERTQDVRLAAQHFS